MILVVVEVAMLLVMSTFALIKVGNGRLPSAI